MYKKIIFLFFLGVFSFLSLSSTFMEKASASTDIAEPEYIEYAEGIFVNKEFFDEEGNLDEEAACLLKKATDNPGGFTTFAVPEDENCVFWYSQNFDTLPYNYINGLINGLPIAIALTDIKDPRLSIPIGLVTGLLEAIKAPNVFYGRVEYYNCYYPNGGDFKKVMKLTKYFYDPGRAYQYKTYVV